MHENYVAMNFRLPVSLQKRIRKLAYDLTQEGPKRVTMGDILERGIAALERELSAAAPTAPEDEIRPEVRAAAREAGLDV